MSDISDMITIKEVRVEMDAITYQAELKVVAQGQLARRLNGQSDVLLFLKKQLTRIIMDTVYKDIVEKLDMMRRELYVEARSATFEGYTAKIEMAEKIGKLANELKGM